MYVWVNDRFLFNLYISCMETRKCVQTFVLKRKLLVKDFQCMQYIAVDHKISYRSSINNFPHFIIMNLSYFSTIYYHAIFQTPSNILFMSHTHNKYPEFECSEHCTILIENSIQWLNFCSNTFSIIKLIFCLVYSKQCR